MLSTNNGKIDNEEACLRRKDDNSSMSESSVYGRTKETIVGKKKGESYKVRGGSIDQIQCINFLDDCHCQSQIFLTSNSPLQ